MLAVCSAGITLAGLHCIDVSMCNGVTKLNCFGVLAVLISIAVDMFFFCGTRAYCPPNNYFMSFTEAQSSVRLGALVARKSC